MNDNLGIFTGVEWDEYLKIDALNGSSIVNMRRSPMYYRFCLDNPQPSTPAQNLGTWTHRLILEPHRVGDFAVWGTLEEEKVRRGKVWDSFCELNAGATIITVDERDAMVGMAVAARKNPPVDKYAKMDGDTEVTMVWRDVGTGRLMKGRMDKVIPTRSIILDLKTTRDCHSYRFGAQAYALGYHIKAALYISGYQVITGTRPKFKWMAIESKAPHEAAVYRATPDVLTQGNIDLDELVRRIGECEATGYWPPDMEEEEDLILPTYAFSEADSMQEFAEEGVEDGK